LHQIHPANAEKNDKVDKQHSTIQPQIPYSFTIIRHQKLKKGLIGVNSEAKRYHPRVLMTGQTSRQLY